MKRSEMIQIVYEKLRDCAGSWKDISREVLDLIEEKGMLPPVNPTCKMSTIAAGEANEWEPEDETK